MDDQTLKNKHSFIMEERAIPTDLTELLTTEIESMQQRYAKLLDEQKQLNESTPYAVCFGSKRNVFIYENQDGSNKAYGSSVQKSINRQLTMKCGKSEQISDLEIDLLTELQMLQKRINNLEYSNDVKRAQIQNADRNHFYQTYLEVTDETYQACFFNRTIQEANNRGIIPSIIFQHCIWWTHKQPRQMGATIKTNEPHYPCYPFSAHPASLAVRSYVADLDKWQECIEQLKRNNIRMAQHMASKLIENKMLPSQYHLNRLYGIGKQAFPLVENLCKEVCTMIKNKYKFENCERVWTAYTMKEPKKIVFVVEIGRRDPDQLNIDYEHVIKNLNTFSKEDIYVFKHSKSVKLSEEMSKRIQYCMDKHGKILMKKHKHLSVIQASAVRSKSYDSEKNMSIIIEEPCLLFYVRRKGLIPIEEEPFKDQYDGIPVDVREGAFKLFMPGNQDTGETLKMGCQIASSYMKGSLGGFVEHLQFGLCGLTCAHAILNEQDLQELKRRGGNVSWPETKEINVYLPGNSAQPIGQLVHVAVNSGGGGKTGFEIAMFQITKGYPKSGEFNMTNNQDDKLYHFDSGKPYGQSRIFEGMYVYKIGAATGLTKGKVLSIVPPVCVQTGTQPYLTLHNQIEIIGLSGPNDERCQFASEGDSGALVMTKSASGENFCIGMIVGGILVGEMWPLTKSTLVTPIVPILEQLGISSFKSFETGVLSEQMHAVENRLARKIDEHAVQTERLERKVDEQNTKFANSMDNLTKSIVELQNMIVAQNNPYNALAQSNK